MEMSIWEILKEAYSTSDSCGKLVVWVLFIANAISWSIIANKLLYVQGVRKKCARFKLNFQVCNASPLEMVQRYSERDDEDGNPLWELCRFGIKSLLVILGIREFEQREFFRHGRLTRRLSGDEIEKIKAGMNRIASDKTSELDDNLTLLGTLVTLCPLLGLFGTVWGVMATFIGIAQQGQPDIATIAPGISGALLTTVGGLVVSIPSLFANNFITHYVDNICVDMDNFINDFITSLKLEDIASENGASAPASQASAPVSAPTPVVVSVQPVCPAASASVSTPAPGMAARVSAPPMSAPRTSGMSAPQAATSTSPVSGGAYYQPRPASQPVVPPPVPQAPAVSNSTMQQTFVLDDED